MAASGGAGSVRARMQEQEGGTETETKRARTSKESAETSPFLHLTVANLVTAGAIWLLLDPHDANAVRRTHPLVRDALTEVPWHRVRAPVPVAAKGGVPAVRRFAAAYPAAACALHLTLSARTRGAALAAALPRRVTRLTLCFNTATRAAARAVQKTLMALPPRMTELALYDDDDDDNNCEWQDAWWEAVSFLHLPALTALRCALSNIGSVEIATLPPSLTLLDVRGCPYLDAAMTFAHMPALSTLNCEGTRITDAAIASLPPSITHLNMKNCNVTNAVTFAHLPVLQTLTCAFTRASNAAIASLSPTVHELCVEWCTNVTAAATFAHLPSLRVLNAKGTTVGDAAIASLSPSITNLHMGWRARVLTPAATLRHLPALAYVSCFNVETATVAALLDTLPHHARGRRVTSRYCVVWTTESAASAAKSADSDTDSDADSDADFDTDSDAESADSDTDSDADSDAESEL